MVAEVEVNPLRADDALCVHDDVTHFGERAHHAHRPVAAQLHVERLRHRQVGVDDKLEERETHVFYDKNEQHRILAQDVEDYLRPIYQTDAAYVVVLLGPFYPKKLWTKFESDNFKQRFKENAVIPIWFDDAEPGLFDETTRVGGIMFQRSQGIEIQADEIVELCCKRLQEFRVSRE